MNMKKKKKQRGFFDEEERREKITSKDPLEVLSTRVNWEQFRSILEGAFKETESSKGGRPPFDRLMMFKILVLAEYYGLSDDQIEFQILDRLSFQRFIGQGLEDTVPDAKTIWLFRQNLTKAGAISEIFNALAAQLTTRGLIAKKGVIVDASFVKVPVQRNSREENEQIKNDQRPDWSENKKRQKDTDANWVKKNGVSHFGYKQHIKADQHSKLIIDFQVTSASVHDSQVIDFLVDDSDIGHTVYADSAYHKKERIEELKRLGIYPRILEKGTRDHELTDVQKARNHRLSSKRCRVEHIFAWLKQGGRWMIRGIGIERITARIALRLIGYNLSRSTYLIT